MTIRRIAASELALGQALPWDVYGEGGGMLAKKGHLLASANQIEMLLERGFVGEDVAPIHHEPPSVLRMLNLACVRLQAALEAIAGGRLQHELHELQEVAGMLADALRLDSDVALACILLNQAAGPYPVRHGIDSAIVAMIVARALKRPEPEVLSLTMAALTMNVGMLRHHERFQGATEPLPAADLGYIRDHAAAGVALLRAAGVDDEAWLACVLQHHENEDGSGYPAAIASAQIGPAAKIVMLADRYCARVGARAYRKTMLPNAALRDLLLQGKETVDAHLASVLIHELGIYPVGTFVKLLSGEIGVVTRQGAHSTTPHVLSLLGPWGGPLEPPLRRDSKIERHAIREVLSAAQAGLSFRLEQVWGGVAKI
ncbi:hypothetical protein AAKU55_000643 [Oxalobacteraceae bacterium GrIS 1.11]